MTATLTTSLVGAHFRPPAKALLACLPSAHPLWLRPEPSNEYDENAIQVLLLSAELPTDEAFWDEATIHLTGAGFDKETILGEPEWHLGFLPKAAKNTPFDLETNIAHQLAVGAACGPEGQVSATLSFDSAGKPMVQIPWPPAADGCGGKAGAQENATGALPADHE